MGQAATARGGIREYHEKKPDITLMDVRLPDMNGIDALMAIRSEAPNARVVMLSMFRGDVEIQRALKAGARGFLLKTMPPSEIAASLRRVHAGRKCIPAEVASEIVGTSNVFELVFATGGSALRDPRVRVRPPKVC